MKQGYKQTEIGVIPEEWRVKHLNDFGDVISGGTPSTSVKEYWDGTVAWCTPSDITSTKGKYIFNTDRYITNQGLRNSSATVLPENSILLCTRATIGELKLSGVPMATNQGFKNLCSNDSGNVDYLYYLLQTKRKDMLELAIGSTFLEISKKALCSIALQTPPLPEQELIAEALSDVDNMIISLEKLIAKKRAIKQGAMQELLTGKKRLPGFAGEWRKIALKELIKEFIVPMRDKPKDLNGPIPWCRIEDFNGKYLYSSKSDQGVTVETINNMNLKVFPKNTLLVSCSAYLGRCAIVKSELVTNQTFIGLVPNDNIDVDFLFYVMNGEEKNLNLLSSGTTISYLSREQFEDYKIYIPCEVSEQTAIASILSDMDSEIEALEQKLEKTRQVKRGMMQELLTGRIRLV